MSKEIEEATRDLYVRLRRLNGWTSSVDQFKWAEYLENNPRGILILLDPLQGVTRKIRPLIEARTRKRVLQQTIKYIDGN